MDQRRIAFLQREGGVREVVRGHALQHCARGNGEVDAFGYFHQHLRGNGGVFGVGAYYGCIGYAVARRKAGYAFAQRFNHAGGFLPQSEGDRQFVEPGSLIDVYKIDAAGGDLDQRLTWGRLGNIHFFVVQFFGTAGVMDQDGFHECTFRLRCTAAA